MTRPHIRLAYLRSPSSLLRWVCASPRAIGYGTTPHAAYNDWLINYRGDRS